jgi:hypothetical protein
LSIGQQVARHLTVTPAVRRTVTVIRTVVTVSLQIPSLPIGRHPVVSTGIKPLEYLIFQMAVDFRWGLEMESVVPVERIELPTNGLQNRCSTAELNRLTN